ncbi:MAG: Uma2 family endonuclease [Geitlerinemataceae cyanobacterium]
MVQQLSTSLENLPTPDVSQIVTEDDTPVDNFASEKHQRLLVSTLYSSLERQPFLASANVGIYHTLGQPPIVPDVFLSLDVEVPDNWWEKQHRCYLVWEFGKPPEVAIEIVSNREGEELGNKLKIYERMRVSYYIVFDPNLHLGQERLYIYELRGSRYLEIARDAKDLSPIKLEQIGLGVTIWLGEFEGKQDYWLRWCDHQGNLLLTGDEKAQQQQERAERSEERVRLLAEQLRSLGVNPDEIS